MSVFLDALARLTSADREQAQRDMIAFGQCCIETMSDGTARLLHPVAVCEARPDDNPYSRMLIVDRRKP